MNNFLNKILISVCLLSPFNLCAYPALNEFSQGEKPYILQYRANIRNAPNRNSEVIAIVNMGEIVEILEKINITETINDVWGYWYKIKYKNVTGYTFGGNIARKTIIADIDRNGINDYFFYRRSAETLWNGVNILSDIIIYLNNERISTWKMNNDGIYIFDECRLIMNGDNIIIELFNFHRDGPLETTVYRVNNDGTIEFIYYLSEYSYSNKLTDNDILVIYNRHNDSSIKKSVYKVNNDGIIEFIYDILEE